MGTSIIQPTPQQIFKFGRNKIPIREMKTLQFGNFGSASTIAYPQRKAWERNISKDPLGNDLVGDCAEAAPGHGIQNMTMVANYGSPTQVTKVQVIKAYSDITGYDPSKTDANGYNPTDQGSNMLDVCKYLQTTGLAGFKFDGYIALNPQNISEIQAAIYIFGWVYAGIVVPQSLANQLNNGTVPDNWNYIKGDQESDEGHALSFFGYGRAGFAFNSWGTWYHMDIPFWLNWVNEVYALVSKAWLKQSGISPSGFDLQGLLRELPLVASQVN